MGTSKGKAPTKTLAGAPAGAEAQAIPAQLPPKDAQQKTSGAQSRLVGKATQGEASAKTRERVENFTGSVDSKAHWSKRLLEAFQVPTNQRPLKLYDRSAAENFITNTINERFEVPIFENLNTGWEWQLLCDELLDTLKTQGRITHGSRRDVWFREARSAKFTAEKGRDNTGSQDAAKEDAKQAMAVKAAFKAGHEEGYQSGMCVGKTEGHEEGYKSGKVDGKAEGREEAMLVMQQVMQQAMEQLREVQPVNNTASPSSKGEDGSLNATVSLSATLVDGSLDNQEVKNIEPDNPNPCSASAGQPEASTDAAGSNSEPPLLASSEREGIVSSAECPTPAEPPFPSPGTHSKPPTLDSSKREGSVYSSDSAAASEPSFPKRRTGHALQLMQSATSESSLNPPTRHPLDPPAFLNRFTGRIVKDTTSFSASKFPAKSSEFKPSLSTAICQPSESPFAQLAPTTSWMKDKLPAAGKIRSATMPPSFEASTSPSHPAWMKNNPAGKITPAFPSPARHSFGGSTPLCPPVSSGRPNTKSLPPSAAGVEEAPQFNTKTATDPTPSVTWGPRSGEPTTFSKFSKPGAEPVDKSSPQSGPTSASRKRGFAEGGVEGVEFFESRLLHDFKRLRR
ncbi:hypothetical protein IWZ00DRAFT_546913 [Phyllosticta capitalensis]|uniref:uncharacterized protein n=1 Tax=Phyllosticta capitalensis TaxID=121624 RepID=UPI003130FA2B